MAISLKNGFATTAEGGDNLITTCFLGTGAVHWVDSANGNDANSGSEGLPLATIGQAITNATDNNGDIVIVKSGHAETLSSAITVDCPGLRIMGIGNGSDAPNITVNAAIDGINVTADDVILSNIYFNEGTNTANTSRINVSGDNCRILSCTFDCGEYDLESITLASGANNCVIDSCAFSVTADGPDAAIEVEAAVTGLYISNCSFNGGSSNFDVAAINSGQAHLNFVYENLTLTNEASILHSASATGIIANLTQGDGSQVTI